MDDTELEQAFRDGLQGCADGVDVAVPLVERARSGARRRRARLAAVGTAAAVVVAVAVLGVALTDDDPAAGPSGDPQAGNGLAVDTTGWRTEAWHGVQVEVPADWGWGTAPRGAGGPPAAAYLCGGPGALVRADGHRLTNPDASAPYVGRPIMLSDLCAGGDVLTKPEAPYVWLGADIEPGTVELGNGWVQETVEVAGTTVTVGSKDAALRAAVLASATPTEGCPPALAEAPTFELVPFEGMSDVLAVQVCAYQRDGRGDYDVVYATALDAAAGQSYMDAVYAGQRQSGPGFCRQADQEYVVITLTGTGPYGAVSQDSVIAPECAQIEASPGIVVPLTPEATRPWSRNGLQAVLSTFIGMLG